MPDLTAFTNEKNKQQNSPIWLYQVQVNDTTTLYLAEATANVVYPTGGQTYTAYPITHEGISRNILGEVDSVKVRVGNVDRTIGAFLIASNGLKGRQVKILLVFADLLADANANITDTFWIDASTITDMEATFVLTNRMDLYQVKCPTRKMHRDFCQWDYKKEGCWIWGGSDWVARSGFTNASIECDHTRKGPAGCSKHTNTLWFGGFPTIPRKNIYLV